MKNIKEDLYDEDSKISSEKYDYNIGRDVHTFMV
jgi:hypothetical protein